jgi:uncharacterized membrane protein YeaQ/YmgE (transglycosylase-associated protein family)
MLENLMFINLFGWGAVGLLCGAGAGLTDRQRTRSFAPAMLAGVAGAIIAAFWINSITGFPMMMFTLQSLIASCIGAAVFAFAARMITPAIL